MQIDLKRRPRHDDAKLYDRILTRTDIEIQRHYHQRVGLRSKFQLKFIKNTLKFFSENFRCGSTEKSNFHNPGAATGWWNWSELDSKCLDWCIDDHCIVYNVWTNSTELLEAVKSLPSMWLPTHCGSLLFAEHSPGLKDPMHNRNSLVEGNQVTRYWYHYYTSLCNALKSSRYCWPIISQDQTLLTVLRSGDS